MEYPPQITTFRPMNKTRKIKYPQLIKKYEVKNPKLIYYDDFRYAMKKLVNKKIKSGFMNMIEDQSDMSNNVDMGKTGSLNLGGD